MSYFLTRNCISILVAYQWLLMGRRIYSLSNILEEKPFGRYKLTAIQPKLWRKPITRKRILQLLEQCAPWTCSAQSWRRFCSWTLLHTSQIPWEISENVTVQKISTKLYKNLTFDMMNKNLSLMVSNQANLSNFQMQITIYSLLLIMESFCRLLQAVRSSSNTWQCLRYLS